MVCGSSHESDPERERPPDRSFTGSKKGSWRACAILGPAKRIRTPPFSTHSSRLFNVCVGMPATSGKIITDMFSLISLSSVSVVIVAVGSNARLI